MIIGYIFLSNISSLGIKVTSQRDVSLVHPYGQKIMNKASVSKIYFKLAKIEVRIFEALLNNTE